MATAQSVDRLLRLKQIIGDPKRGQPGLIPVSKSQFYLWISEGRVPKPLKPSPMLSLWRESDILRVIAEFGQASK